MDFGSKGQGESLIKLLVVAIIAVIALALAKSYFRESARVAQKTVEDVFNPSESLIVSPFPVALFSHNIGYCEDEK